MKANTFFEEDIAAMLDSLQELFQEYETDVTETLVAERMERKLHRHVHYHQAAYLYRLMGFDAIRGNVHTDKWKYYVVPDLELLPEKRAQLGKVISPNNKV